MVWLFGKFLEETKNKKCDGSVPSAPNGSSSLEFSFISQFYFISSQGALPNDAKTRFKMNTFYKNNLSNVSPPNGILSFSCYSGAFYRNPKNMTKILRLY